MVKLGDVFHDTYDYSLPLKERDENDVRVVELKSYPDGRTFALCQDVLNDWLKFSIRTDVLERDHIKLSGISG